MRQMTDDGMNGYVNQGMEVDQSDMANHTKQVKQQEELNNELDYCRPKTNGK